MLDSETEKAFDAILDRFDKEDRSAILSSLNATVGLTGHGPSAFDEKNLAYNYIMYVTEDDLKVIDRVLEEDKKVRQEIWWASKVLNMGEVDMPIGGSRYATKEEVARAKEILGAE